MRPEDNDPRGIRAVHPEGIRLGASTGKIRLRLGHLDSAEEQVVAISDFCARNGLEPHSSNHSLHTELTDQEQETLTNELREFFGRNGHWFWFSLNELAPPQSTVFPAYTASAFAGHDPDHAAFDPHASLRPTQEDMERLQERIRSMEASPFWSCGRRSCG